MTRPQRLIVLWIRGLTRDLMVQMPAASKLAAMVSMVSALEPVPITGDRAQALQLLAGRNPGATGWFDEWSCSQYHVQSATWPVVRTLDQLLADAGCTVSLDEVTVAAVPAHLQQVTTAPGCLVVRTAIEGNVTAANEAIAAAHSWAGPDGVCMLLTHHHSAPSKWLVNLNNALRTLGLLEIQSGQETPAIAWDETLAYAVGNGQIRINLQGREPNGIVSARDEYEKVRDALVASLPAKLINTATEEPVIERIYRRDELYSGDYLFQAPDLVAVLRPAYAWSAHGLELGFDDMAIQSAPDGAYASEGGHPATVAGFAAIAGSPVIAGNTVPRTGLMDIAPTILYLLDLPIPLQLDGKLIAGLFPPSHLEQSPARRVAPEAQLSPEDEQEIMARLQNLGYIG